MISFNKPRRENPSTAEYYYIDFDYVIHIIHSGSFTMTLADNNDYDFNQGDVILLKPYEIHKHSNKKNLDMTIIPFHFFGEDSIDLSSIPLKLMPPAKEFAKIQEYADDLLKLIKIDKYYANIKAQGLLYMILGIILQLSTDKQMSCTITGGVFP